MPIHNPPIQDTGYGGPIYITPEGGMAIRLINKTGANSVKGSAVISNTALDNSFILAPFNPPSNGAINCIGAVYENGIPDGSLCYVVIGGIAEGLLTDNTASTTGNWVGTSISQTGRFDMNAASPPNQTRHFEECGHCTQTVAAGINKLAKFVMHFN